ncbi:MAG: glycosyltransferase family 2 protein [Candidatus Daviesbacteria bacterium]
MNIQTSVVINTLNEEKNIERVIKSVNWADEIIVCDMNSEDRTVDIAKKLGAKIVLHKRLNFVEPARNYAISKASNEWVLIVDADEEIPEELAKKLQDICQKPQGVEFVEIPRKNIIFNKWMQASFWWPDYNIRFFKKGFVVWSDKIHSKPKVSGEGLKLFAEEQMAIIHYNYQTISQFVERMNRYSGIQAKELELEGVKFNWQDLISKPTSEFLSRFFANKGFEDGLHGLALSFLQAFSFLLVYLKLWEVEKFKEQEIKISDLKLVRDRASNEINYWLKYGNISSNPFKRIFQRARNKIS